jgi:predicted ester cyclase
MSLKELEAKIQRVSEEAWYNGNVDGLAEVYAADYVSHRPPFQDARGLEAVKQYLADTRLAYSDMQATYTEWIAQGDAIAYRYTMRMKHTGVSPSLPVPPTGKELTLEGCVVVRVKDGKVIEEWEYSDYLGFLQQLGIVPSLG